MASLNTGAVLYVKQLERMTRFYAHCCGLETESGEADHVVMSSAGFQLVLVALPEAIARTIVLSNPPARRADTPIKLVFHVDSLLQIRERVSAAGGVMNDEAAQWRFQDCEVCDALDPEGNVLQFRQRRY